MTNKLISQLPKILSQNVCFGCPNTGGDITIIIFYPLKANMCMLFSESFIILTPLKCH